MIKKIKNLEEMKKFAISVANKTKIGKKATIFCLYGDLGSGKTTFTKGFVSAFGVKQNVTSPTFVIEKIYNERRAKRILTGLVLISIASFLYFAPLTYGLKLSPAEYERRVLFPSWK